MFTPKSYLWIILVFCVARGRSDVFHKKNGQDVIMDCGDAVQNNDVEWKLNDKLILRFYGKNGRKMKGKSSPADKAQIIGTNLKIPSLGTRDAGVYTCTGYNTKGTKNTWQHTLHIVSVIARPADVVLYSTEVTLTCDIPEDLTVHVQWLRPPNLEPFGNPVKTVTLNSVNLDDAGQWVCQITDEKGEELKIEVNINVVGPLMSTEEITVLPGATTELPCFLRNPSLLPIVGGGWVRSHSDIEILTLERQEKDLCWSVGGIPRIIPTNQHPSTNFSVKLTKVQPADAGVYVCTLMYKDGKNLSAVLNLKVVEENSAVVPDAKEITTTFGDTAEIPCSHPDVRQTSTSTGSWWSPLLDVSLWVWAAVAGGLVFLICVVIIIVLIQNKRTKKHKSKYVRQKREKPKVHSTITNTQELLPMQHETKRLPPSRRRERPKPPPRTHYYENIV